TMKQHRVLLRRRTREQHQPAGQADEHQKQHPYCHGPAILPAPRPSPPTNPTSATYAPFWNPTGLALEHRDLVAQQEDLGIFSTVGAGEPAEDAEHRHVSQS